MPTPASPGTNTFHCESCGRDFNTEQEFHAHEIECSAAKATGSGERTDRGQDTPREGKADREWFSTP